MLFITHKTYNKVTIASSQNTTVQGAQVSGQTITALVGGNLSIASRQDASTYASRPTPHLPTTASG